MSLHTRRAFLATLPLALAAVPTVHAEADTESHPTIRMVTFPGGANLPLWVAQEQGFIEQERISVEVALTPNSVALMRGLFAGQYHVAWAAFDNVIAYQAGQGEVSLPSTPDLFAFMGVSRGNVRLVVAPEIRSYADLRGKKLGVDALSTGFALVLRKLLHAGGLRDDEVVIEAIGGTAARAQALMEGRISGTILTTPLEIAPEARGFRRLADVSAALGPYQTGVGIASRAWAWSHRGALEGFIRASSRAISWLYDAAHREEAVAIYRKYLPSISAPVAHQHINAMLGDREGFARDGRFDFEALATVLRIRAELGVPPRQLGAIAAYVDDSYRASALMR